MWTLAIIINYYSAHLTLQAVSSILESESAGPVDVVVVDNSRDRMQAQWLKEKLNFQCKVIISNKNLGFGRACNLAMEGTSSDTVLLLNPDAILLPNALKNMQKSLFSLPRAGAVGPQIFWDNNLCFYLPPSYPPNLYLWQQVLQSRGFDSFAYKAVKGIWRRFSIRVWKAQTPVTVPALSGGHMLLKREAIDQVGGLFDPRFFMYFEDTDLCKRLTNKGYSLYVDPNAIAVHTYGRCETDSCGNLKKNWMKQSMREFKKKHLSSKASFFQYFLSGCGVSKNKPTEFPEFTGPFTFKVPDELNYKWLFEWSPNLDFIPSVGNFGSGRTLEFSKNFWDILRPGKYFGRISQPNGLFYEYVMFSFRKDA